MNAASTTYEITQAILEHAVREKFQLTLDPIRDEQRLAKKIEQTISEHVVSLYGRIRELEKRKDLKEIEKLNREIEKLTAKNKTLIEKNHDLMAAKHRSMPRHKPNRNRKPKEVVAKPAPKMLSHPSIRS